MIKFCNFHIINKYKPTDLISNFIRENYHTEEWFDDDGFWHRDFNLPAYIHGFKIKNRELNKKYYKHGIEYIYKDNQLRS